MFLLTFSPLNKKTLLKLLLLSRAATVQRESEREYKRDREEVF